jgi:hypothetical protein
MLMKPDRIEQIRRLTVPAWLIFTATSPTRPGVDSLSTQVLAGVAGRGLLKTGSLGGVAAAARGGGGSLSGSKEVPPCVLFVVRSRSTAEC